MPQQQRGIPFCLRWTCSLYGVRRGARGGIWSVLGRLLAAPTGAHVAVFGCRGLYGRPGRTGGIVGLAVHAAWSRRHGGMPPYGVRRGCGGKCRLFGRICNPPLQVRSLPFPAVGAHYICARTAPPEVGGLSVITTRPWRHAALRGGRGQKRSAQATRTRQSAGRCGHRPLRRSAGMRREAQACSGG